MSKKVVVFNPKWLFLCKKWAKAGRWSKKYFHPSWAGPWPRGYTQRSFEGLECLLAQRAPIGAPVGWPCGGLANGPLRAPPERIKAQEDVIDDP